MLKQYTDKTLNILCFLKGYSLEEIKDCIVSQEDNIYTLDTDHVSFPKERKPGYNPPLITFPKRIEQQQTIVNNVSNAPISSSGAGTELKKLLGKIGIKSSPTCSCNKRATLMDTNGIEWCENNIDTIVGWLKEEATKRKLPFIDMAGKILVKKAISNAKKTLQDN
jgi:hypothetical protein